MRSSVVFCLMLTFSVFGFGVSLQCYSCPDGSSEKCSVKEECSGRSDACLKLQHHGMTYTSCVAFSACDFNSLSQKYLFTGFSFTCCQSSLCNGPSFTEKLKNFIG